MININTTQTTTIDSLQVGDQILSKNGGFNTDDHIEMHNYSANALTGHLVPTSVVHIQQHTVTEMCDLNNGQFRATPDHMMIFKIEGSWVVRPMYVAEWFVGNCSMMGIDGVEIPITSYVRETGSFTVYDLDTEPNDTFYANGILTHNRLHPNLQNQRD